LSLLRHPTYAGAYRYGHRPSDPRKKQPGRPATGRLVRRPDECLVLIRDRLPAYIGWDRFEANQARLGANRDTTAPPRARRDGPVPVGGAGGGGGGGGADGRPLPRRGGAAGLPLPPRVGRLRRPVLPVAVRPGPGRTGRRPAPGGGPAGGAGGEPGGGGRG